MENARSRKLSAGTDKPHCDRRPTLVDGSAATSASG